jgi:hypothetical protein
MGRVPTDHVLFFVKIFEHKAYADEFMKGKLYLQPLSAFKRMEDKNDGRADRHEAPLRYFPRAQLGCLWIGSHRIDASELQDDIAVQPVDADPLNIFCVYAATPGRFAEGITSDTLGAYLEHLKLPKECLGMGRYAVLIAPPQTFSRRFRAAAEREGFRSKAGLVDYFDATKISGPFKDPVFNKKQTFAWQREFRFVVNRRLVTSEPYLLDIGDISDLCRMTETATFNEQLKVALPEDDRP